MPISLAAGTALAGGASALGGIISSIFGRRSNNSANATNMKIAQMNNEWSEKMMDKQNEYNIAQWMREAQFSREQTQAANSFTEYMQDKANKYNSASEQAKRLMQAGLNPALVMSGQNAGTAQGASGQVGSTPSGNSVGLPSPSSATVQPYDYSGLSRSITDAVMTSLQAQKQQAEVTNMNLQNEYLRKSMQNRIKEQYETMRSKKYDTDYREMNESVRVSMENEQYLSAVTSRLMAKEQITLVRQQQVLNDIQTTYLPEQMKADIALKIATAEYQGTTDLAKDLKFFEKKFGHRISQSDLKAIFTAWKQNILYSPTRGMSATGAAATIGNVFGNWIRR